MSIFLDGISAQYYRGIGEEIQLIGPFSSMNLFIGSNNSGKSIILNLIHNQLAKSISNEKNKPLQDSEVYRGKKSGTFQIGVARSASEVFSHVSGMQQGSQLGSNLSIGALQSLKTIIELMSKCDLVWANPLNDRGPTPLFEVKIDEAMRWPVDWPHLWNNLTQKRSGSHQNWIPETIEIIASHVIPSLPPIHLIPAKRILGGKDEKFDDLSGKGLIDHLLALQAPDWNKQQDRNKFQRINDFLQFVTGKDQAKLEVPNNREHLLVHMDNKVLPLSSLGTGIHEVILIAAFCTIHDDCIMCIEEPEIHLHPILQRKLITYLSENTKNQYFIATHSSSFIDTPGANIFHVSNDGDRTRIQPALTKDKQREILDDLGQKASDILQSNAIIWVEGPSDRIYINHWIKSFDNRLQEGLHYSVMFYGGALIRHLSASDEALTEFIKLRDLNRNVVIIVDSDRSSEDDQLKKHVERIAREMTGGAGMAWVTAGREVENYIDGIAIQQALKTIHPTIYYKGSKTGRYDHSFYFVRENPDRSGSKQIFKDADKVSLANQICKSEANLDVLDLRDRIEEVVKLIKCANGMT